MDVGTSLWKTRNEDPARHAAPPRSLDEAIFPSVDSARLVAARERSQRWLARQAVAAGPLPLAVLPDEATATADLASIGSVKSASRTVHFKLLALDTAQSSTPGISLGREIATRLALTMALLVEPAAGTPPGARLSFVRLDFANPRAFLHPATTDISPLELRGRYLYLRLLTEWAVHALLRDTGLLEMNCCWLGLARALLLVPTGIIPLLHEIANRIEKRLAVGNGPKQIRLYPVAIPDRDWEDGDLRTAIEAAFADERTGRQWSDAATDPKPSDAQRAADLLLSEGFAAAYPVYVEAGESRTGKRVPLHPLLTDWIAWNASGGPAGPDALSQRLLRCPDATPTPPAPWMRQPLAELTGLAFLRADIRGYKTAMHERGGSMLAGMQSQCTYNQALLMNAAVEICTAANAASEPSGRVLLVHCFSDDAVIYGPVQQMERVAERLRAAGRAIAHGLDVGLYVLPAGATAADGARGALAAMQERRPDGPSAGGGA